MLTNPIILWICYVDKEKREAMNIEQKHWLRKAASKVTEKLNKTRAQFFWR